MDSIRKLPGGFAVALLQNPRAMQRFYQLTPGQRQTLAEQSQAIQSRAEMKAFVARLADPEL